MKKLILFTLSSLLFISVQAQKSDTVLNQNGQKQITPPENKNIAVFPAKLSFDLDRGGSSNQSITVRNTTSSKYQLAMEFIDWTRDTLGNHIYTPLGKSSQSCASWVTFDKPFIELGPNESTTVTVTMKVPDNAEAVSEMKWTMLVVKTVSEKVVPTKGARLETQIQQTMGVGIHILQTPPNITNKEVKMLSFAPLPGPANVYRIACKNTGGVQLNGKFSVELSSSETGTKTALKPQLIPLFPQQSRYVDFTLPADLPKGKYTAIALIDADDDSVPIEAAEKEIVVK